MTGQIGQCYSNCRQWDTQNWSRGTWRTWLKVRVDELSGLPCGSVCPPPVGLPVTLHVFDIHWFCTPERWERLRAEPKETRPGKVARSKLFRHANNVATARPVDTTARVVGNVP